MKSAVMVLAVLLSSAIQAHVKELKFKVAGEQLDGSAVEAYAEFTAGSCKEWVLWPVIPHVPYVVVPQRHPKRKEVARQTKQMGPKGEVSFTFKNPGKQKCDYHVSAIGVTVKGETRNEFFVIYSNPNEKDTRPAVINLDEYLPPYSGGSRSNVFSREIKNQATTHFTFTVEGKMP